MLSACIAFSFQLCTQVPVQARPDVWPRCQHPGSAAALSAPLSESGALCCTGSAEKGWTSWRCHSVSRHPAVLLPPPLLAALHAKGMLHCAVSHCCFVKLHLVGEEQADRLQALLSPVHIVPKKEVVGLGRKAAVLEQAQQVGVLAVDVTWRTCARSLEPTSGLGIEDSRCTHRRF